MTFLLREFFSFFRILHSETGSSQIALGIASGFVLGMTPFFSLQSFIVFLLIFIFRIQVAAAFLSAFFFSFLAFFLDPLFHFIGVFILERNFLKPFFTELFHLPFFPYTRFNNSLVMGSCLVSFLLFPLVYFYSKKGILKYRDYFFKRFQNLKVLKIFKKMWIYEAYLKWKNFDS